jgi:hypothetical protein
MSTSPGQGIPDDMSQLVSSIREVQKMQGQVREKLAAVQAQQNKPPPASTAGGPTGTCTNWMQTNACKASGPLQVINGVQTTHSCSTPLQSGWSGYCQCGATKIGFDCNGGQNGRTCDEICKQTGAAAYGPMPATDAIACLQGGGVYVGQGGSGFAAGSPGTAFPGCPSDASCCVPLAGTINVSDADEIYVTGASGAAAILNGTYSRDTGGIFSKLKNVYKSSNGSYIMNMPQQGWSIISPKGYADIALSENKKDASTAFAHMIEASEYMVAATGPFAKDPTRIPVGSSSEPWLPGNAAAKRNNPNVHLMGGIVDKYDTASTSSIRLAAASKTDVTNLGKQHAELSSKLQELEGIETTLLDELRTQRLAASNDASASSLALRAETKAAAMVHAESEEQRRRLARQRGISAKDTTLIVAARSAALRAAAYGRLTIVALGILIVAFIVYRLNITGNIGPDGAFLLAAAAGGAGLIVVTVMLNNIHSRSQRDFSKFYFPPPPGPSVLAGVPGGSSAVPGGSSAGKSDHGSLRSCERAFHALRSA